MKIEIINDSFYDKEENQDVTVYELILTTYTEDIYRLSYDELCCLKKEIARHLD